ncbi:MAG: hypothetical protein R3Y54_09490 [Eubacteriales bacterium]
MRLTIKSNGKVQILEITYIRESSNVPNLRIHNTKGLSQAIIMPDLKTRNRILRELSYQGYAYVNIDDKDEVMMIGVSEGDK